MMRHRFQLIIATLGSGRNFTAMDETLLLAPWQLTAIGKFLKICRRAEFSAVIVAGLLDFYGAR